MFRKKPAIENDSQIGNLLDKYRRNLKPPQASVEKVFIKCVEEVIGFTLTSKQVTYTVSTRTITIHASSILKAELKQKQEQIIKELKKSLPEASVPKLII